MHRTFQVLLLNLLMGFTTNVSFAQSDQTIHRFSLEWKNDYRYFVNEGLYPGQEQHFPSIALQPEYTLEGKNGKHRLQFTGFFRWDAQDDQRTHGDIRELYWQWADKEWEVSIGAKKVFWGVTESIHLVDIINQTDFVESFDGEEKLGQPMIHTAYSSSWGNLDFFYLPYFRKRQFPGEAGRLRTPFLLDAEDALIESNKGHWHPDLALRWSHSMGPFDIGLSHFYGTGREPYFQLSDPGGNGFEVLYPLIHQTGLDIQAVTGPILWKYEAFYRNQTEQEVFAFAGGMEYTLGNVFRSGIDIGILSEYLYDNRDEWAISGMDNDVFIGSRIAFNDVQSTQILLGGIWDLSRSSRLFSLEASRRVGNSWKIEAEGRIFSQIDSSDQFFYFLREDSFMQLRISKFF